MWSKSVVVICRRPRATRIRSVYYFAHYAVNMLQRHYATLRDLCDAANRSFAKGASRVAEEELLTVPEAARRLRLSQETIRRWLRENRIQGIRLATARAGWRIPASAVDEMLSGGR